MPDTTVDGAIATVDSTISTDSIVATAPPDPIAPPTAELPADPPPVLSTMQVAVGDLTKIVGDEAATAEAQKAVNEAEAEEAIAQAALDAAKQKTIDARAVLAVAIGVENADVDTAVDDVAKLKHA